MRNSWTNTVAAAGLIVVALVPACSPPPKPAEVEEFGGASKILIISIDCMRADRLAASGYDREIVPAIDAIAADGIRFERAYAQANWTKPSVASLFTGRYVRHHGVTVGSVIRNSDGRVTKGVTSYPLPHELPVLAEVFKEAGYKTLGAIENVHLASSQGFGRGFDTYIHRSPASRTAIEWLARHPDEEKLFAYVHLIGPHDPYDSTTKSEALIGYQDRLPSFPSEIDFTQLDYKRLGSFDRDDVLQATSLYDAELSYFDGEQVARIVRWLREKGWYDDFLIIVTSDHGEELYDHQGWAHGHSLYEELIRVPLVVKLPRNVPTVLDPGKVLDEIVEQIDLMPTLLELARLAPPELLDGESLAPLLQGLRETDSEAFAIAEYGRDLPDHMVAAALVRGNEKLIVRYPAPNAPEVAGFEADQSHLFLTIEGFEEQDVTESPNSRRSVARLLASLRSELGRGFEIETEPGAAVELSQEERDELTALGYLGS